MQQNIKENGKNVTADRDMGHIGMGPDVVDVCCVLGDTDRC